MTVRPTMPAMVRPTTVVYFFCVDRGGGTPAAGPPRRMLGCSRSVKGNRNMITTSTDSKREPERNPYRFRCASYTYCMQSSSGNEYPVGSVVWRHSQKRERISGANRHMRPSDGVENGARAVRVRGSRSVFGVGTPVNESSIRETVSPYKVARCSQFMNAPPHRIGDGGMMVRDQSAGSHMVFRTIDFFSSF